MMLAVSTPMRSRSGGVSKSFTNPCQLAAAQFRTSSLLVSICSGKPRG